jgi:hypothetical protein
MGALAASAATPGDDALVFVTMKYANRAQLQSIAARFQHLAIDERHRTASVEATRDEITALRRAGIDVRIDDAATQRMRAAEAQWRDGNPGGRNTAIAGYPCYRTVDETYATMDRLARDRPDLAQVVDIGPTWLESRSPGAGHRMRALVLTNSKTNSATPKPAMVVEASIHAREYTPAELMTRFAESLVDGYGTDAEATWLLDNFRFHLILQANPDGREKAETGLSWRKNVDNANGSCSATTYGIDLNRNFPFQWNRTPGGSSGGACASTYRGPAAASETESQDLLRYIAGTPDSNGVYHGGALPDRRGNAAGSAAPSNYAGMFLDMHSYNRVVLWPWSYSTSTSPNSAALQTFGRRLAWYNGYKPEQWVSMYAADGTTTDTVYGLLGAPSYTIELGVAFFESCSTFEGTTLPKNLQALRFAARNLWAPYRYPSGPTTTTLSVAPASVVAGAPVTVTATVDDGRFSKRNGTEPVQAITRATVYLDQQPWSANAVRRGMTASDGRYDEIAERTTLRLSTTGLARGRHVVFVQGTDASGRVGTPQAVYFNVQ